ncbi:MAG: GNAT family N-acetyltransferase [Nitrospirae bacterium]|nr:GNAT family N-acetyltransferase [Nitrospirota bacterium]
MTPPYKIVHTLEPGHYADLARLLTTAWWQRNRARPQIIEAVRNSGCVVALLAPDTGKVLAFARALTDRVAKALVLDVIVDMPCQGAGLGTALMDAILAHPAVRDVRDVELYCLPEMRPFYARWGFTESSDGVVLLRRPAGWPGVQD